MPVTIKQQGHTGSGDDPGKEQGVTPTLMLLRGTRGQGADPGTQLYKIDRVTGSSTGSMAPHCQGSPDPVTAVTAIQPN